MSESKSLFHHVPRVRVRFAWYDLWVGAYIDRAKRVLYICPLPMLLVEVHFGY